MAMERGRVAECSNGAMRETPISDRYDTALNIGGPAGCRMLRYLEVRALGRAGALGGERGGGHGSLGGQRAACIPTELHSAQS